MFAKKIIKFFFLFLGFTFLPKAYAVLPPGNFKAKKNTATSVRMSWSAVQEVEKYNIYVNDKYLLTTNKLKYTMNKLKTGRYSFYIVSVGRGPTFSSRSQSQAVVVGAPPALPATIAPKKVTAKIKENSLSISWTKANDATKYNVYVNNRYLKTTANLYLTTQELPAGKYSVYVVAVYLRGGITKFSSKSSVTSAEIIENSELRPIVKLLGEGEMKTAFGSFTRFKPKSGAFGVYPILPKGNELFLGVGTGGTAFTDGGAIFKYQTGKGLKGVTSLNEQGILSLIDAGNTVFSPGVDPCCGDLKNDRGEYGPYKNGWDWGNAYFVDSKSLSSIKTRSIPNSIHGWGAWFDKDTGAYYYAGSGHMADGKTLKESTSTGQIFVSHGPEKGWNMIADRNNGAGLSHTYDIIGIQGRLYIQYSDNFYSCSIARSDDKGYTWKKIKESNSSGDCVSRLYSDGERLIYRWAVSVGHSFGIIDANDKVARMRIEDFYLARSFHNLAQDREGNFYVSSNDGRIMVTTDFISWKTFAKSESVDQFNSIAYWPAKNSLVLSHRGLEANLFKVDLP